MGYIGNLSRTYIRQISRGGYYMDVSTVAGTGTLNMLNNRTLKWISVISPVPVNLSVGTTPGGNELLDSEAIPANEPFPIEIGYVSPAANTTIYFTAGVVSGVLISCYRF